MTPCGSWTRDEKVRVIIITGNEQTFAAARTSSKWRQVCDRHAAWISSAPGTDSQDQRNRSLQRCPVLRWEAVCEFAMTCDMIIASGDSKIWSARNKKWYNTRCWWHPATLRGTGQSQNHGLILTGRFLSAEEAHQRGLVIKVVPVEFYLKEAIATAAEIAAMSPVALLLTRQRIH